MTEAVDQRSPLLDLPPELRNRIYEYALAETEAVQLTNMFGEGDFASPGLLATCRRIRGEAKTVYLAENTFMIRFGLSFRPIPGTWSEYERLGTQLLSSWLRQWVGEGLTHMVHKLYCDNGILDKTEAAHAFTQIRHRLRVYDAPMLHCTLLVKALEGNDTVWFAEGQIKEAGDDEAEENCE